MRLTKLIVGFAFALSGAAAAHSANLAIQVEDGDWGNAPRRDIETVLNSVADALLPNFPQRADSRVTVGRGTQGPVVLLDRSADGAYRVLLDVNGARWDQLAYQFSHELCHVFTNFEHRALDAATIDRDHQWFEETLCEAVSLATLDRLAVRWAESPPHPAWRNYAPAFREYAQQRLAERHRQLPEGETIEHWLAANREAMERDPYLREKNELLAARLLPLLEGTPGAFEALGYLNAANAAPPPGLPAYLATWYDCCPPAQRPFVAQVIALLEGRSPPQRARPD